MNNHREMPEVAWYLLQCKPRQNNRAGEHLARKGFKCVNPIFRASKLHGVKVKRIEQPMLPGYAFSKTKAQDNWTALSLTRCVSSAVNSGGQTISAEHTGAGWLRQSCSDAMYQPARLASLGSALTTNVTNGTGAYFATR